MGGGWWRS
ncbi:hypothetical protein LINPERPRIM_LOCUS35846 [Linum perenne]